MRITLFGLVHTKDYSVTLYHTGAYIDLNYNFCGTLPVFSIIFNKNLTSSLPSNSPILINMYHLQLRPESYNLIANDVKN